MLNTGPLSSRSRVEVVMRVVDTAKGFFRGFKSVYEKVAAHRKPHEHSEVPLFDSGLSLVGDWILDLAVLALIAVVAGAVIKWAYLAVFHR
jgi:hypothetical protein